MAVRGKVKGKAPKASQGPVVRHPDVQIAVEMMPVEKLIPYTNNARSHSDDQVAQIAASIAEFGFNDPVAVDSRNRCIIEGHGRVMAAKMLGYSVVPVIQLGHMTENQQKAYMLAHNKIALNSSWDHEKLAGELSSLQAAGQIDGIGFTELSGFETKEIRSILNPKKVKEIGDEPKKEYELTVVFTDKKSMEKGHQFLIEHEFTIKGESDGW